ncbi:MAG: methyltransferase [Legionellales bacterium]|nr:methyltransferase [Legionellales bacterium]|tara:strand:- start:292 stop:942 length:651 start_codon:yes stop_codon:yes gene_type:complete
MSDGDSVKVFYPQLCDYATKTSCSAGTLLDDLWRLTRHHIHGGHMLCGPVVGRFLQLIIRLQKPSLCFELGTFTGYSALHIAQALSTDAKLITCERNPIGVEIAKDYFQRSGVGHKIDLWFMDFFEAMNQIDTPIDFAFIDGNKRAYPDYHEALLKNMRSGSVIMYDNTLFNGAVLDPNDAPSKVINEFNHFLVNDTRVENVHLTIMDGLQLVQIK